MTALDDLGPSAGAWAAAVAGGVVSARELVTASLDRIAAVGGSLNAVVVLDADRAIAAAAAVDDAVAAGRPIGPLAGVPVTVKEAFAVAGLPTTAGMAERAGTAAAADAPAVASLRAAGAIIMGKTNVPTQLADLQSANPVYGRTSNPWDRDRSPGGSSGGSAAALAAGLSALELGSDLSGSIRVPASWCGVCGLRPSNGWISKRGHLPWPLDGLLEPPTSVVGPMARRVADLSLAFAALAGVTPLVAPPPARLRIAVWSSAACAPVDTETAEVLAGARAALEAAGVRTDDFTPPFDVEAALALAWRLVNAEITHGLTAAQWAAADAVGPGPMTQLLRHHLADQEERLRTGAAWDAALDGVDAVLCPAAAVPAIRHDATPRAERLIDIDGTAHPFDTLAAWSVLVSLGHQPSVTMPGGVGAGSGLPIGVQLVGARGADASLLAVAGVVEEVMGGWRPPPGW